MESTSSSQMHLEVGANLVLSLAVTLEQVLSLQEVGLEYKAEFRK